MANPKPLNNFDTAIAQNLANPKIIYNFSWLSIQALQLLGRHDLQLLHLAFLSDLLSVLAIKWGVKKARVEFIWAQPFGRVYQLLFCSEVPVWNEELRQDCLWKYFSERYINPFSSKQYSSLLYYWHWLDLLWDYTSSLPFLLMHKTDCFKTWIWIQNNN